MEGLSVEPAAAVGFTGLEKLVRSSRIKPSDVAVINCTGHTTPIGSNILGEYSYRRLVLPSQSMEGSYEEGLLAALSKVAIDRYPCIEIVDDNADTRRLISLILQTKGTFKVLEASTDREAVELAMKEHPDLIILGLIMPELNGFGVMDSLKIQQNTVNIPIILVTAKGLTPTEKELLKRHIQPLSQKGDITTNDLADELRALIS